MDGWEGGVVTVMLPGEDWAGEETEMGRVKRVFAAILENAKGRTMIVINREAKIYIYTIDARTS